ncbi:MAG: nucleoside-diphosphate kinase [Holophagaceae bacterium]|nr:nucleoside-diphosphate kinase [Holophagaceae bacterium]
MALERTFAIIKPNAVQDGHIGEIITAIEQAGFVIHGLRMAHLTPELIEGFYREHIHKAFFPELEAFMMESPVILMVLEGEDAVRRWRELMGVTDSSKAAPGTLRNRFGKGITRNAVHGSDAPESAERELHYFFSAFDLV